MRYETEKYTSGPKKDQPKTFTNSKHNFGKVDKDGKPENQSVETDVAWKIYDSLDECEAEISASGERDTNLLNIFNTIAIREQKRGVAGISLGSSATREAVVEAMKNFPKTWTLLSIIEEAETERKSAKKDVDNIKALFLKLQAGEITQEDFLKEQARILGMSLASE